MLDHVFIAVVETVRRSLDDAMLDGGAGEERLQLDVLLGDLTWEAGYSLPGEGTIPRVRADLTLDWPTWSQTAYRSWMLERELDEPPELGVEIVFRLQELASLPDLETVRSVLDGEGPDLGRERLRRTAPLVEHSYDSNLGDVTYAVEFTYDGSYEFTEPTLDDPTQVGSVFGPIGTWVASVLVRLGDLKLAFRPPAEVEEDE
jgi:hypothetical protein